VTGKKDAKKIRMTRRWFGIYAWSGFFDIMSWSCGLLFWGVLLREWVWKLFVVFGDGTEDKRVG
jgi:hypothetical protein